jgi:hypothetical protein
MGILTWSGDRMVKVKSGFLGMLIEQEGAIAATPKAAIR